MISSIPRAEFPNPAFERKNWSCLNGDWDFAFDYNNEYENSKAENIKFDKKIVVPFCYQSKMSGIHSDELCENIWYKRTFEILDENLNGSVLLKFGAVDYIAKVWINGSFIGKHEGGFTPFEFEISKYIHNGTNEIIVKAEDSFSKEIPRGKQMWAQKPDLCFYTNTSGIWQSVWLEFAGKSYIKKVKITPNIDDNNAFIETEFCSLKNENYTVVAFLSKNEVHLGTVSATIKANKAAMTFSFEEYTVRSVFDLYWTPNVPNLIDVKLTLIKEGETIDEVHTYFGMRKIHKEGDRIFLNNEPLYQRLVLDQGYWADSLMTPPSDEAIKLDLELTKKIGFNGARKHQKIEDPRYYYWADKMGLLVWGELPSAYEFSFKSRQSLINEMCGFVERDYNHPCIINWVPLNESWGVPTIYSNNAQQNFARTLYYLIKTNDSTRLVTSNDGWEQIKENDICGIHDYVMTTENAFEKYSDIYKIVNTNAQFKSIYAKGEQYNGVPIIVTEYGGIKMKGSDGWGYLNDANDADEFLTRLTIITNAIRQNKNICGFCYTQLTDVMQETNGLLDENRNAKISIEKFFGIFSDR